MGTQGFLTRNGCPRESVTRLWPRVLGSILVTCGLLLPVNPAPAAALPSEIHDDVNGTEGSPAAVSLQELDNRYYITPTDSQILTVAATEGAPPDGIGPFALHADAHIVEGFGNLDSLEISASGGEILNPVELLPSVFQIDGQRSSDLPALAALSNDARYTHYRSLDNPEAKQEYWDLLAEDEDSISPDDPLAAYVQLNLGIRSIVEEDYGEASYRLLRAGRGDVAGTGSHRLMAMWRLAWVYHHTGDRDRAYRLYRETLDFSDDNYLVTARVYRELGGLVFEFRKHHGLGSWDEVRHFLRYAASQVDPSRTDTLSILDLMYAESFYYEGNYEDCIQHVSALLDRYGEEYAKVRATGLVFKGLAHHRLGESAQGVTTLGSILEMEFGPEDRWYAIPDFQEHAIMWLEQVAAEATNDDVEEELQQLLENILPGNE